MGNKIRNTIIKHWITISLIIMGAILGYLYWFFIGCTSGTCPLKSIWYYNVLVGSVLGYLIGSSIQEKLDKTKKDIKTKSN